MGRNFLGVKAVTQHFGVRFLPDQVEGLAEVPFSEETLQECEGTHILFPGYPLSILEMRRRLQPGLIRPEKDPWYAQMSFATGEAVELRWYLMRAGLVPGSADRTFDEQRQLLADEGVPRACEVVYMTVLHYLVKGIRLFNRGEFARCIDTVERYGNLVNGGVMVGTFDSEGLRISCLWLNYRLYYLGVASSRKLKT